MNQARKPRSGGPSTSDAANRTPFQLELVRLIAERGPKLGTTSGRELSARLGKSSNHLWQILNRGMVPSGSAILDIARLLELDQGETEGLILRAIETKGETRSRDRFWIQQVREMVARRDAELAMASRFLQEKGLGDAFQDWRKSRPDSRPDGPRAASQTP